MRNEESVQAEEKKNSQDAKCQVVHGDGVLGRLTGQVLT
jgi:hypothetical protein